MKTFTLLLLFLAVALVSDAQSYYVVNNQPGIQADYRTLQGAVDSVPSGSVILLQPAAGDYGNITVSKPVVIYGTGYFLGENNPPYTQPSTTAARIRYIRFRQGSSGSMVSGIHFTGTKSGTDASIMFDTTSNITVSRCYFENFPGLAQGSIPRFLDFRSSANITLQQSFFSTAGSSGWVDNIMYTADANTGIRYLNNIITGGGRINTFGSTGESTTFINNTIIDCGERLNGNSFYNNIILFTKPHTITEGMNGASSNNISNKNIFPNASANQVNVNLTPDSLFLAGGQAGITSTDGYYKLKTGTVATGYGNDGKDCGAFGGSRPYVLSGIPAVPHVYALDVAADATTVGGLIISLKVKANQ